MSRTPQVLSRGQRTKASPHEPILPRVCAEEFPAPVLQMLQERFGNEVVLQALQGGGDSLGELLAMALGQDVNGQGAFAQTLLSNSAMQQAIRYAPQANHTLGAQTREMLPATSQNTEAAVPSVAAHRSEAVDVVGHREPTEINNTSGAIESESEAAELPVDAHPSVLHMAYSVAPPSQKPALFLGGFDEDITDVAGAFGAGFASPELHAEFDGEETLPKAPAPVYTEQPPFEETAPEELPTVVVEEAPEAEGAIPIDLNAAFAKASPGDPAANADVGWAVLLSVPSVRPPIDTALSKPALPLEGAADPARIEATTQQASIEASASLHDANNAIVALPLDPVVQPIAADVTVAVPEVPAPLEVPPAPTLDGMLAFEQYTLAPADREAFDRTYAAEFEAALAPAGAALTAGEQALTNGYAELLVETEVRSTEAHILAESERDSAITDAQSATDDGRAQTLEAQMQAADNALGTLNAERQVAEAQLDARIAADQSTIDAACTGAQAQADELVAEGAADAAKRQADIEAEAQEESWWDGPIDLWQDFVQSFAEEITALWDAITAEVKALLDAAVTLAAEVTAALVEFAASLLDAYYDFWKSLITELIGTIFPEFAAALCALVDEIQVRALALLEGVRNALLAALEALALWVVAAMQALRDLYLAGVAAYLALIDAAQQGQWNEVGTMVLTAILAAAGIDPAAFFEIVGKADEVIDIVLDDPGVLLRNGLDAVELGLTQFGTNFLDHFIRASVEWLTGAVGLEMPESFDLAGIFDVTCQVLGLTYEHLREKAVEHVGEDAVTASEKLYEGMMALLSGGWSGLWEYVQGELVSLVDDVVLAIGSWLLEKAILVAGRWIVGLFATAGLSSIVELVIAGWQFLMWCLDNFHAMYDLVQTTIESVHAFVTGDVQPAADKIESTLHGLIAPAIDLLAKLLNISNIADKVQGIIEGVREMIDNAIDKVFVTVLGSLGLKSLKEGEEEGEGSGEFDGELGEELPFDAAGEGHRLWVAGSTVMVASTPMPVPERLSGWRARLSDAPSPEDGQGGPTDRTAAVSALAEAERHLETLEVQVKEAVQEVEQAKGTGEEAQAETQQSAEADRQVEAAERPLATVLAELFELFQDQEVPLSFGDSVSFEDLEGSRHTLDIDASGDVLLDGTSAATVASRVQVGLSDGEASATLQNALDAFDAALASLQRSIQALLNSEAGPALEAQKLAVAEAAAPWLAQGGQAPSPRSVPFTGQDGTKHVLSLSDGETPQGLVDGLPASGLLTKAQETVARLPPERQAARNEALDAFSASLADLEALATSEGSSEMLDTALTGAAANAAALFPPRVALQPIEVIAPMWGGAETLTICDGGAHARLMAGGMLAFNLVDDVRRLLEAARNQAGLGAIDPMVATLDGIDEAITGVPVVDGTIDQDDHQTLLTASEQASEKVSAIGNALRIESLARASRTEPMRAEVDVGFLWKPSTNKAYDEQFLSEMEAQLLAQQAVINSMTIDVWSNEVRAYQMDESYFAQFDRSARVAALRTLLERAGETRAFFEQRRAEAQARLDRAAEGRIDTAARQSVDGSTSRLASMEEREQEIQAALLDDPPSLGAFKKSGKESTRHVHGRHPIEKTQRQDARDRHSEGLDALAEREIQQWSELALRAGDLALLHTPDMVAGGHGYIRGIDELVVPSRDDPEAWSAYLDQLALYFGPSDVNGQIGSQWGRNIEMTFDQVARSTEYPETTHALWLVRLRMHPSPETC